MGQPQDRSKDGTGVRARFPVVCLLASAGGLEALEVFFRHVPAQPGVAFLVLQHFPAGQPSHLPELLGRHAALAVRAGQGGEVLEPDQVRVLTPGLGLGWVGGELTLVSQEAPSSSLASGDRLFQSVAECLGDQAIGVILSGSGTDGAYGLKAIQGLGGRTYAQEPAEARFPEMPRHAVEQGVVRAVLPAADLPGRLLDDARAASALPGTQGALLDRICAVLARKTDNDFSRYKPGTLCRRIQHRMQVTGCRSLPDYLGCLEDIPDEAAALLNDLLIGVTEFFRDPEAFEVLDSHLYALLADSEAGGPLRIWVPGCCTGEEAYSIAMLVRERLQALGSARRVQLFATDIDASALMHAKAGRYAADAMGNVSAERRGRFFTQEGNHYRVAKELREMCVFSVQNLIRDPPFSALHLISCRNVFIYLQPDLQRSLVPLFHFALKPQGLLFLGSAEGLGLPPERFEPLDKVSRIFRRRETQGALALDFPLGGRRPAHSGGGRVGRRPGPGFSATQMPDGLFERMLLEDYVPASAIVNELGDVLLCAGRIGRFLHPPMGVPSHNLLHSCGGALRRELRSLLARVAKDAAAHHAVIKHDAGLGEETLKLTVRPMPGLDRESGVYAVILESLPAAQVAEHPFGPAEGDLRLLDQMELELRATQVELQATQEELGSTNEEFRASHEELQASNEELQASQEELQSVNEELTTINQELQQKIGELRGANSDLQNILVATNIAMLFLDEQLRITRFTPAIMELFRLIDGDLGRPIRDILPLFEGADLLGLAREVLASHGTREEQVHSLEGDRWFIARALPYRTLAQVVSGVVVTFTDITDVMSAVTARQESEQARMASEERLTHAMQRSHVGVWEFNLAERTGFRTQEHANLFGYASDQSPWSLDIFLSHVLPEDRPEVERRIRQGCAATADWSFQCRIRRTDGELRWIQVAGGTRGGSGDRPGWMAGIVQDITERKQAEEEIRQSEERFAMAFHASPDAIAITRFADGVYRLVNEGFTRFLGYTAAEVLGRSSKELAVWVDPLDRVRWATALQEQGHVTCLELTFRRADGGLVIGQVSSRPMTLAGETVQLSIIRDITGLKREEEERRLLESEVEHMQRLESLGRLAGGVAHDMNNVLGAIYAVTQALRTRHGEESDLSDALATVERAASRGRDLVKGLVGFSRKGLGEVLAIDLNLLVRQEVALLDRTLMQRYRLVMDLEETLPAIVGEIGPLGSALMNLCVNAVDAMPEGGTLTLRTRRLAGDLVQVSVEDTGEGMTPEVLKKAMEPFFTTKPFGRGTGLGLAMVLNAARAHRGTLALQSEPGQGTQAFLTLPAAPPELPLEAPQSAGPVAQVHRNILLVDDDELLRASVPPMLRLLGHHVDAVDGGPAALDWLAAGGCPDLVILDVNMPGMGGLETLQRLRATRPTLPVLLATGYLDAQVEAASREDSWVLALAKPFTISEIQRKFEELGALREP